jgi:hypothetical protein
MLTGAGVAQRVPGCCLRTAIVAAALLALLSTSNGCKRLQILQWEGYGTGLKETAAVAAEEGHSVGVLYNDEVAAAASVTPQPVRPTHQ